jgi:hypothetical protein
VLSQQPLLLISLLVTIIMRASPAAALPAAWLHVGVQQPVLRALLVHCKGLILKQRLEAVVSQRVRQAIALAPLGSGRTLRSCLALTLLLLRCQLLLRHQACRKRAVHLHEIKHNAAREHA